jgi:hypothetical protein
MKSCARDTFSLGTLGARFVTPQLRSMKKEEEKKEEKLATSLWLS